MRYKLREEKNGAIIFDQEIGEITRINEIEYQEIIQGKNCKFDYLLDSFGHSKYKLFKSAIYRENLPDDCLIAPSKVYLELTRRCNLNCVYCYNKSTQKYLQELNVEQIYNLLSELSKSGTFEIRLTGGEPSLHKNFEEIVNYAELLGFFLSVSSSGVINSKAIEILQKDSIRIIIIGLDGPKEYNDLKRGKGTFDKVIDTVNKLKDKTIKFNCVICKENIKHLDYVAELSDKIGISGINITPLVSIGRAEGSPKYNIR